MDYEVISNIVGCWLTFNGSELRENLTDILYTMEFQHPGKNASQDAWNVQCAVADYASYGYAWNTQTCITRSILTLQNPFLPWEGLVRLHMNANRKITTPKCSSLFAGSWKQRAHDASVLAPARTPSS